MDATRMSAIRTACDSQLRGPVPAAIEFFFNQTHSVCLIPWRY